MFKLTRKFKAPEWGPPPFPRFPRKIGYYPEDHSPDFDLQIYTHPQVMRTWYTRQEKEHAQNWSDHQRRTESGNYNSGLHFSGDGPFERELKRKGIQVEKYKLPSTVAMKRVHEMTILRRTELEKRSAARLEKVRNTNEKEPVISWLDESDGPVNSNFLRMIAGKNYGENIVANLSRTPILKK